MSHAEFRSLERILRAEGRLADFVLDVVSELEDDDQELRCQLIDRLTFGMVAPEGSLMTLSTDLEVRPGETATAQILVPSYEDQKILCYRIWFRTNRKCSWRFSERMTPSGFGTITSDGDMNGEFTIPFGSDPFTITPNGAIDLVVTNLDGRLASVSFALFCRRLGGESAGAQIERLASFILESVPGEPAQNQGAVDTAIRIMSRATP